MKTQSHQLGFLTVALLSVGLSACQPSEDVRGQTPKPSGEGEKKEVADATDGLPDKAEAEKTGKYAQEQSAASKKKSAKREHKANRLAGETSPYLLMHAHNPVDWYPWGEEAFAKARDEKKIIFLSIGYSSCYWCHVMERESFMDEEIADYLNEHFVCIKVDREERPDVDDIYMTAVQILTQRGGWPLSAFLTPDAKPFFGGTYFPPRRGDRGAQTGFLDVIQTVRKLWMSEPHKVKLGAKQLATIVGQALREQRAGDQAELTADMLDGVQDAMQKQFDSTYGGFGFSPGDPQRPKFPSPPDLFFLIRRVRNSDDDGAKKMLAVTLDNMARGGIRDHLGGGFHRYSTDRFWHIPHFEKMLYDNGQLASVYAEAYELTDRGQYRQVADELLEYVLREMTSADGAFYTAMDAETDAEEGKFYRWEAKELASLLNDDELKLMGDVYSLAGEPNFEHEYYVPLLTRPFREIATDKETDPEQLEAQLAPLRARLLAARDKRERPLTDTKILTSWNGLMIRGFADCGRIFKEEEYTAAAARAADFVLENLRTDNGRLQRTWREGKAKLNAYVDDYAFLVDGLIAIYRATGEKRWLEIADELTQKQIELFWDEDGGGFFFTSEDHETLIARAKKRTDGVLPSGNSVSIGNLVFLASALSKPEYLDRAEKTLDGFSGGLADPNQSRHMTQMAVSLASFLEAKK